MIPSDQHKGGSLRAWECKIVRNAKVSGGAGMQYRLTQFSACFLTAQEKSGFHLSADAYRTAAGKIA
ncbi:hypothetical protein [Prosthecochloris sp. ZM]|uniref:hypothetical protein n=1 Tax=Prosthecochloris sp. ZM TaxID=2283143 RepID=UPI0011C01BDF|nr:hypothetical protein [Prosthecochloris sp. ZM]